MSSTSSVRLVNHSNDADPGVEQNPAPSNARHNRFTQSEPSMLPSRMPNNRNNQEWCCCYPSLRHHVTLAERRFDTAALPADLQRVYQALEADFGEPYALMVVFVIRTAVELHRAWHMTLLTSKILQQLKSKFGLRMTWNLGVVRLIFRVEDGRFELHRRVPYDYDAEFQDTYWKIAVAVIEEHISVHEALIFQGETKLGLHTARSGLFLRGGPGRLLLYPLEAATCTVIFFGGDGWDAAVAALCGLLSGSVEYVLTTLGGDAGVLVDVLVGFATGVLTGIFYRFHDAERYCVSSIFLGTLYWFFYGTAFVIGILEIIAGELETGVTRFIAVSVKTFVLTLGSCIGFQIIVVQNVFDAWVEQDQDCYTIDLGQHWWRIPLYLLCSAAALGQYRTPLVNYWRGLAVQLAGYEVQYQMFEYFAQRHDRDFLDTAISNITGAMAAVVAACALSYMVDSLGYYYNARLLQRNNNTEQTFSPFGELVYKWTKTYVQCASWVGVGRKSSTFLVENEASLRQNVAELRDPHHPRKEIRLKPEEEAALVEAIVDAENLNVWSLLMPAVYQLVPGSLIAKLWYNAVFPPPLVESVQRIIGTDLLYTDVAANPMADNVFYGLWVISTSLALGLLLGFAVVQVLTRLFGWTFSLFSCCRRKALTSDQETKENERVKRLRFRQQEVMTTGAAEDDDPTEYNAADGDNASASPVVLVDAGADERGRAPTTTSSNGSTGNIVSKRLMQQGIMDAVAEDDPDDNDK